MGRSLKAGSFGDRSSLEALAGPSAIVVALLSLALAAGGYSGGALAVGTAAVWLLVLVAVIARPATLRDVPPPLALATVLLCGLLGWSALSLGWGVDDGAGFEEVVRLAGYLGAFVLIGLVARPGDGRSILVAVAVAAVGVALIALGSRLLGIGGGDFDLAGLLPPSQGRLSYPLGYWNALGALVVLAIPVLVHLAAVATRPRLPGLLLAAMPPVLLAAYMTSSRGALLAALVGASVVIWFAEHRRRASAALLVGIAGSIPSIVAASAGAGILDTPGTGSPGSAELIVLASLLAGVAAVALLGSWAVDAVARTLRVTDRLPRVRPLIAVPVLVAVVTGLVLLAGPGRLVDDFRSLTPEARTEAGTGILNPSGSGRAQFWRAAADAFADEPIRGIGSGGYATYWNQHGSLGTPTRNAHSEPLELLAELGIVGFALFAGFSVAIVLAGLRQARAPQRPLAGAALGLLAAGSVGFLIDWTWQIPANTVPVLMVAAALAGRGFATEGKATSTAEPRGVFVPAPIAGAALVLVAIAAVWAAGVLGVATSKIAESRRLLVDGEPADAARAARAAIAVEPWSADPWFQLAEVERSVDNIEASKRAVEEAIDRSPDDFRGWFLLSTLESDADSAEAGVNYGFRAIALAPKLLTRIREFLNRE